MISFSLSSPSVYNKQYKATFDLLLIEKNDNIDTSFIKSFTFFAIISTLSIILLCSIIGAIIYVISYCLNKEKFVYEDNEKKLEY